MERDSERRRDDESSASGNRGKARFFRGPGPQRWSLKFKIRATELSTLASSPRDGRRGKKLTDGLESLVELTADDVSVNEGEDSEWKSDDELEKLGREAGWKRFDER